MKKVLAQLYLISFLAVLLVPVIASAAFVTCSSSCDTKVTADCLCGGVTAVTSGSAYCYNGSVFTTQAACQTAASGGTPGTTGGVQTQPTAFTDVE